METLVGGVDAVVRQGEAHQRRGEPSASWKMLTTGMLPPERRKTGAAPKPRR